MMRLPIGDSVLRVDQYVGMQQMDPSTRPAAGNLRAQQRKFNRFREEFNTERPHEALDMRMPAQLCSGSTRPMPDRLPAFEYPDRLEVRYVSANSGIRW
jgi:hypothetical protein